MGTGVRSDADPMSGSESGFVDITVVDGSGHPLTGCVVSLIHTGGGTWPWVGQDIAYVTDSSGKVNLRAREARYEVRALFRRPLVPPLVGLAKNVLVEPTRVTKVTVTVLPGSDSR